MSSITTSDEILTIDNLNLVFRLRYHQERSAKALFINLLKQPIGSILRKKESLYVLRDISLSVKRGDRLAIIGVNGSGKTTLCRCVAQMLSPTSGKIFVHGTCRAVLNTSAGILPELTGRENARLLARLLYPNEPQSNLNLLLNDALQFSELKEFLDAPYETYSQGMRARLCLSVITAKSSDLIILDEVYDNTDQFFQSKMTARLRNFISSSGAVIFVSHSPEYIRNICNRAIVLHESRLAYAGPVDQALKAYEFLNRELPQGANNV